MSERLPTIADIRDAAARLSGLAVRTPLIVSPVLSARFGRPIYLKPECLQRTGSFKFRGAYNQISRLAPDDAAGGVIACSSGNHAQGVAEAATLCGLSAMIVMPHDAPEIKRANTEALGAEIVAYDRATEDRDAIAMALAEQQGRTLVPPYDDPMVIAGQGTVGLEIAEDAACMGVALSAVLVPAGGGGLAAGIGLAIRAESPSTAVYVVEPEGFDDHARSLASGTREANARATGSLCDALMATTPGRLTFELNRANLAGGIVIRENEVAPAMRTAFRDLKLVVEPGGAVGLAALLAGRVPEGSGAIAIVLSGGNVDAGLFCRLIDEDQPSIDS